MQQRNTNNSHQGGGASAPQQQLRQALPSLLPVGSRDRAEAITQLRKVKSTIKYSDLYCDDFGSFFCHVTLHRNVVPYLPQVQDENNKNQQPPRFQPLSEQQALELGIEFKPSGCWTNVPAFDSEPNVLLFKAEPDAFFAARQRQMNQDSATTSNNHNNSSNHNNNSYNNNAYSGSTSDQEQLPPWMILDKREHYVQQGSSFVNGQFR